MENPRCPGCGRVIGLFKRNGEQVASEYHRHRREEFEKEIIIHPRAMIFNVRTRMVCDYPNLVA